jgi:gliding motility-associated-like protein
MVTCAGTGQFQFIKETTNNACFRSDTVNIFVEEPAQVDIMQNDTSICVGGEVQLNATSSQADPTFSWSPAAGLSCTNCPDPIASPENTTTYTVTSGTGNCQGQNTITIEVGNPQFDLIPDSLVCIGDEVQLGLVHDPNTTYTWTASSGETVPAVGDPTVSPTENTLYILNASMGGCEFADSVFITVNEYAEVDLTANAVEFCSGETIELSAATISGVTIVWTGQNMNTSVGPNITANTPNPGTFTYTVTVDNGGCITQESIQVTVFANPILDLNDDAVICPGQSVILGNIDDPNTTYTWTTSTGVTVPPIGNPEVNPFETTTYTVTATIASCEIVESITVIVNPLSINAGEDEFICSSQSVDLLAVGEGGNTYSWAPAEGLSCTDCPNPVATPTETTTYVVTYSLDGECAITDSVTVEVGSNLLVEILPDTIINQGAQVQLSSTVTATDGSIIGDLTYSWDPTNGLSCTDCPNPIANPFESTSYTLSVVSEFGCVGVSNTINIVIDLPLYALPNAFTPDGDDLNDRFRLMISDGAQITIRNFRVFNRWGKLIYDNPSDLGWDGRYEGELVPQDVYIYIIELQRADGTVEILKGDVTLLR